MNALQTPQDYRHLTWSETDQNEIYRTLSIKTTPKKQTFLSVPLVSVFLAGFSVCG